MQRNQALFIRLAHSFHVAVSAGLIMSQAPAGERWILKREGKKSGQQQNNLPVCFTRSPSGLAIVVCISNDSVEMITLPQGLAGMETVLHYIAHYYSPC